MRVPRVMLLLEGERYVVCLEQLEINVTDETSFYHAKQSISDCAAAWASLPGGSVIMQAENPERIEFAVGRQSGGNHSWYLYFSCSPVVKFEHVEAEVAVDVEIEIENVAGDG
jgi:hypothetical protein